jgi:Zn-dependent peptidase ImmA (M78 family)
MNSNDYGLAALHAFHMAHRFLYEYRLRWLPVDIKQVAIENWNLKWAHNHAEDLNLTNNEVCCGVLQSYDGATFYYPQSGKYEIILNIINPDGTERLPERVTWTCAHEVGHIYLGHFTKYGMDCMANKKISPELYDKLEFEADMFAGEVLASKWLLRDMGVESENDVAMLCGISDPAALSRYRKATANYSFVPANVIVTRQNFAEYLREITLCWTLDKFATVAVGDVRAFAKQNTPKEQLSSPKPKFLHRPGNCPYCDGVFDAESEPNYCLHCGNALIKGLPPTADTCGSINPKEAAFCTNCGNRVFRIQQGFCFSEDEI